MLDRARLVVVVVVASPCPRLQQTQPPAPPIISHISALGSGRQCSELALARPDWPRGRRLRSANSRPIPLAGRPADWKSGARRAATQEEWNLLVGKRASEHTSRGFSRLLASLARSHLPRLPLVREINCR